MPPNLQFINLEILQQSLVYFINLWPVIAIALLILGSGVLLGRYLRRKVKKSARRTLKGSFALFVTPLIPPATSVIFCTIAYISSRLLHLYPDIFLLFLKITIAWLAVRCVSRLASRKSAGWFITLIIIPTTLLHLFGLWDAATELLNSASFTIAQVKISAFTIIKSVVAIIVLFWTAGMLVDLLNRHIERMSSVHVSHRILIMKLSQIGLYFVVFIVAMQMLGINLTALSVFGGALGVGIGFGLQKIASNFISGIILLLEKSVQVDDAIELQDGTIGSIRKTGARYTLLQTQDGREVLLPNEDFITQRMTSWTHSNNRARIEINVSVAYDSDIEQARQIMLKIASLHPKCLSEPAPFCAFTEFGENGINILLHFWIANISDGRAEPRSDVIAEIWRQFRAAEINIPHPQRTVYMR